MIKPSSSIIFWIFLSQSHALVETFPAAHSDRCIRDPTFFASTTCLLGSNKEQVERDNTKFAPITKSKWKKKKYLMMNDVDKAIQKGDRKAPRKAQQMIERMQTVYRNHDYDPDFQPPIQAYNLWINAIAKVQSGPDAGAQAEAILDAIKTQTDLQPNVITYTSVMDAYARSVVPGDDPNEDHSRPAKHAERILMELLSSVADKDQPITSVTIDTALKAWSQEGTIEGAERVELILERLEHMQQKGIRPTAHSYTAAIHAWAMCRSGAAAERAERILDRLLRPTNMDRRNNKAVVEPDTVLFNSVIHAWANSDDPRSGNKAMTLLRRMEEVGCKPDTVTFNSVLSAWSKCGHLNAAKQAEHVLQQMQSNYAADPETAPAPNRISFNCVLHAWSQSSLPGAAERAQRVLDYMIRQAETKDDIAPDVYSFATVLNALAKSKIADKAQRARDLLDKLLDLYKSTKREDLRPTQIPFNAVLNACAFSAMGTSPEQQRQALQIAVNTFSQLGREEGYPPPDTVSYGNIIKCFANLVPQGEAVRSDMAIQVFERCCKEGLVGDLVFKEIRRAVPYSVLDRRLGLREPVASLRLRDLPQSWRRNVRGDRRVQQQRQKEIEEKETKVKVAPVQRFRTITETSWQSGRDV